MPIPEPLNISESRPSSPSSDGDDSPVLSAADSSSALILAQDEEANLAFDLDVSDEDGQGRDEDDYGVPASVHRYRFPRADPLSGSHVFLYLLAPCLKLGALLLPRIGLPLKVGLPALLGFSLVSAFARQVWYMLARYFHMGADASLEDVVVDGFLGRSTRANMRKSKRVIRWLVRSTVSVYHAGLAAVYIRAGVRLLDNVDIPHSSIVLPLLFTTLVIPFIFSRSSAPNLASKRITICTSLSVFTYILWLTGVAYSHAKGAYLPENGPSYGLIQSLAVIAFTFTSSCSLELYGSLKAASQHNRPYQSLPVSARRKNSSASSSSGVFRSFRSISLLSISVGLALTAPLVFFAALPNRPPAADVTRSGPSTRLQPFVAALAAITLWLAIPSIIVTTPPLPIGPCSVRMSRSTLSRAIVWLAVLILANLPFEKVAEVVNEIVWILAIGGTYLLPALVHITAHFFRRPLSIIMPSRSALPSPALPVSSSFSSSSSSAPLLSGENEPSSAHDELLQRKERSMQIRQLKRRIVWDVGVGGFLLPVAIMTIVCGIAWDVRVW